MTQPDPLADDLRLRHATVSALQASLLATTTVEAFLQTVVDRAGEHVAAHAACTLTLLRQGRFLTVASTDPRPPRPTRWSTPPTPGRAWRRHGRGVETVVTGPARRGALAGVGGRVAAAGLPLRGRRARPTPATARQLAINLYGRELDAFGEPEMQRARIYVDEAARALRLCLLLAEQTERARTWRRRWPRAAPSTRPSASSWARTASPGTRRSPSSARRPSTATSSCARSQPLLIENLTGHQAAEPPPSSASG